MASTDTLWADTLDALVEEFAQGRISEDDLRLGLVRARLCPHDIEDWVEAAFDTRRETRQANSRFGVGA